MAKKLQVFVSSTYTDLKRERQAAVAAILKSGHIPAGMELFTSGDQSQWNTIKAWIDESDVYMLILGGRYGSVDVASNLGYTELEYDYALQKGKPFFSVVITDSALDQKLREDGADAIEKINGLSLSKFRAKVMSSMCSFFDDEKDIKLCVHESLADFSASKELIGWVPGNSVVDTTPLFDEIKKLSEENLSLRSKLTEQERRSIQKSSSSFEEMCEILEKTNIDIPDALSEQKNIKLSLLRILELSMEKFSHGFDNSMGMNAYNKFLFFTVAPLLKIHGLTQYEKIAGVEYRRCIFTQKGEAFVSDFLKRKINPNPALPESSNVSAQLSPTEIKPPEEKKPKRAARVKKANA